MRKLLVIAALMAGFISGQTDSAPTRTLGCLNGRSWRTFPSRDAKIAFVLGFNEALGIEAALTRLRYFAPAMTFAEVPDAVDRFYAEPENMPIPILAAFKIVQMKATGVPQADIDKELALNRQASNLPSKPPKAK